MTILDLQRRIREAGRIRIGQKDAGRGFPKKLDTFRLTSPDRRAIEQAAGMYGGKPEPWDAPAGRQWQVVTGVDELDVIVPPSDMAFSQHYELWSGGGCQRRCDGFTEQITDGPCLCDPDERECKPHTRLSVMLRELVGLGVWRLDTQGFYAAVELSGAVQVVQAAAGAGVMLPARLRLEQRQIRRPGQPTRNFAVPTLDVHVTPEQLFGGQAGGMSLATGPKPAGHLGNGAPELPAGDDPAPMQSSHLTPVPKEVEERPARSVADQVADASGKGGGVRRAGAAAPVPATGLRPRTTAEAAAGTQPERGQPEGVATVSGDDLESLTVAQLKIRCKRADLPVSGTKAELIERLQASTGATPAEDAEPPHDDAEHGSTDKDGPMTDGQRRKLFATFREHGISDQQRKAVLASRYQLDTMNDLSFTQAAWIIDRLEQEGGPDAFKAVADDWLSAQQHDEEGPDPAPCEACGELIAGEHDCQDTPDPEPEVEAQLEVQGSPQSLAERARSHASGTSETVDTYQDRIRKAFSVLAVKDNAIYEGGWQRLQDITDGRASHTDWTGASEGRLRSLAEDMERAVDRLEGRP
jgi:hypothetical protein